LKRSISRWKEERNNPHHDIFSPFAFFNSSLKKWKDYGKSFVYSLRQYFIPAVNPRDISDRILKIFLFSHEQRGEMLIWLWGMSYLSSYDLNETWHTCLNKKFRLVAQCCWCLGKALNRCGGGWKKEMVSWCGAYGDKWTMHYEYHLYSPHVTEWNSSCVDFQGW
jgi:hypothetical protein